MASPGEHEQFAEEGVSSFRFDHNERSSKSDEQRCIFELERAIEAKTKEKNNLREKLRSILRLSERLDALLPLKLESKERELRHFLLPSVPRSNACDIDTNKNHTTSGGCTISSNVRPVPSLVSSGLTKSADSLLGPANAVARITSSKGGALLPTPYPNPSQASGKSVTHTRGLLPSGIHSQSTKSSVDNGPCIKDVPNYADVLIDSSVNLVLSRLRQTQCNFDKLVAANQSELQSFTFTQNSQNGKRMMMRIRVLEHENEELANVNRTGRTARLESEISLRRAFVNDLKNAHSDMEYLVEEAETEAEVLGSSLMMLQQRLQLTQSTAEFLASELQKLEPVICAEISNSGGDTDTKNVLLHEETKLEDVTSVSPGRLRNSQNNSLYDELILDPGVEISRQSSESPKFYTDLPVDSDVDSLMTEMKYDEKSCIYARVLPKSENNISDDKNFGKSKRKRVSGSCGDSSNENYKSHLDSLSFLPAPLSRNTVSTSASDRTKSRPVIPVRGPQRTFHSNREHTAPVTQIKSISSSRTSPLDECISSKLLKLSKFDSKLTVDSSIKSPCIKSFTSNHPNVIDGSSS